MNNASVLDSVLNTRSYILTTSDLVTYYGGDAVIEALREPISKAFDVFPQADIFDYTSFYNFVFTVYAGITDGETADDVLFGCSDHEPFGGDTEDGLAEFYNVGYVVPGVYGLEQSDIVDFIDILYSGVFNDIWMSLPGIVSKFSNLLSTLHGFSLKDTNFRFSAPPAGGLCVTVFR